MWADQQKTVKRLKRDYVSLADLESEKPLTREKRLLFNEDKVKLYVDITNAIKSEDHVAVQRIFNDELWNQEWYLVINLHNMYFVHCPVIF